MILEQANLTNEELSILCAICYVGDSTTVSYGLQIMHLGRYDTTHMKKILQRLQKAELIETIFGESLIHCTITQGIHIQLTYEFFKEYPALVAETEAIYKENIIGRSSINTAIWEICYKLQQGTPIQDERELYNKWDETQSAHHLWPNLLDEYYQPLIDTVSPRTFYQLLFYHTQEAELINNDKLDEAYLNQVARYKKSHNDIDSGITAPIVLYHFLHTGEYTPPERPNSITLAIEAILSLYAGDVEQSYKKFQESLKYINEQTLTKNIYPSSLLNFYLMICYARSGEKGAKKAQIFLNKTSNMSSSAIIIGRYLIQNKPPELRNDAILEQIDNPFELKRQIGYLLSKFFGMTPEDIPDAKKPSAYVRYADQGVRTPCILIQHELNAYLPASQRVEVPDAIGKYPTLLPAMQPKEYWRTVMDQVLNYCNGEGAGPRNRIAYLVDSIGHVSIRAQHILKNGKWSVGTQVNVRDYIEGKVEGLDETDQKARMSLSCHPYLYYRDIPAKEILPYLIGCDRIYFHHRDGQIGDPVTIEEEKIYLKVTSSSTGYEISSNLPTDHSETQLYKKDMLHYQVFNGGGKEGEIVRQLLAIGKIPLHAKDALTTFLEQIAPNIEIHSTLLEGGSSLPNAEGDPTIYLRIVPNGEAFMVQAKVRPLGNLSLVPGQGKATIYDQMDGVRYQVSRDLKREQEALNKLNDFAQVTLDEIFEESAIHINPAEMLALIEFVKPYTGIGKAEEKREEADGKEQEQETEGREEEKPHLYTLEWPEGRQMNIRASLDTRQTAIRLVTKEKWFEVEGEIRLDNDSTLDAAQLIKMISNGTVGNRFVALGEGEYIALSDKLAKYLSQMESMTYVWRNRVIMPRYQVGALAEIIQNAEGDIAVDNDIKKLMGRIEKASKKKIAVPTQLRATLRPYQEEGYRWLARLSEWGAGGCLADDMGLGKTVQTIALLLRNAGEGPSLVVCPASLIYNWVNELQRFAPTLNAKLLNETEDREKMLAQLQSYDVVITTYGLLIREDIDKIEWNIVCLDEAHTIKNRNTKMSASAMELQAKTRVILTGTPVQNYLSELWNLFQFLNPGLLGTYDQFTQKYIVPIERDNDKRSRSTLRRILQPFMLRRTKNEVMDDLPEKNEITHLVQMSGTETIAYERLRKQAQEALQQADKIGVNTLSMITKLRQAACSIALVEPKWELESSKIEVLKELVTQIVEGGNKVLIFSQFTKFLTQVKSTIKALGIDYLYLDGGVATRQRQKLVETFQHGDVAVFLISLKAGGLGLNLTAANYVIHLDPWWNPAIEQQATDRSFRIGQQQNVTVYRFITKNTIEEKILRLHATKRDLADSILEGSNTTHAMTLDDLRYLVADE